MKRESQYRHGPSSGETAGHRFLTLFIQGNLFYVVSALFMMLGCYLLMKSPAISGSVFIKKLKALLILQGYEILVIATAIIIVRRFTKIGDAFTLFLVEIVLLLDPTFFSNAFFTMVHQDIPLLQAGGVNLICFALVPLKIVILAKMLKIKLDSRTWAGFFLAAAVVFLAEGPLVRNPALPGYYEYYYLLGWIPFFLSGVFPSMNTAAGFLKDDDFATERQKNLLGRFLVFVPLVIVSLHYLESAMVHGIRFYWLYGIPWLLALNILIIKNWKSDEKNEFIALVDVISIIALVISFGPFNMRGKALLHKLTESSPDFISGTAPTIFCGIGLILVYLYFYWKRKYAPALVRIGLILFGGLGYLGVRIISSSGVIESIVNGLENLAGWIGSHPVFIEAIIGLILWIIVLKFPLSFTSWVIAGNYTLIMTYFNLPIKFTSWVPELFHVVLLYNLVLSHLFMRFEKMHLWIATFLALAGLTRLTFSRTLLAWAEPAIISVGLISAGLILREKGYVIIGGLNLLVLLPIALWRFIKMAGISVVVIVTGLVLFIIGIIVSFKKKKILDWLESLSSSEKQGEITPEPWPPTGEIPGIRGAGKSWPFSEIEKKHPVKIEDKQEKEEMKEAEEISFEEEMEKEESPQEEMKPDLRKPTPPGKVEEMPVDHSLVADLAPKVSDIVETVFMHDPKNYIYLAKDMPGDQKKDLSAILLLKESEKPLLFVCTNGRKLERKSVSLMLTSHRIYVAKQILQPAYSIYYTQIYALDKGFGRLILMGHSGQVLFITSLLFKQIKIMKSGLERLLSMLRD